MNVVSYNQRNAGGDFPHGPVLGPHGPKQGPGFDPLSGNRSHMLQPSAANK